MADSGGRALPSLIGLIYDTVVDSRQALDLLDAFFALDDQHATLEVLLPHILRVETILETLDAGANHVQQWLDQLPLAVFVVDAEANILKLNRRAEEMLMRADLVGRERGRLVLPDLQDEHTADLHRRIRLVACCDGAEKDATHILELTDGFALPRQIIIRHGFWGGAFAAVLGRQVACVSFISRTSDHPIQKIRLMQRYGLTPKEARLAMKFALHPNIADLSHRLHRSENTIRSQIKSIFHKTGTHNQAELMRLLLEESELTLHESMAASQTTGYGKVHGNIYIQPDSTHIGYAEYGVKDGIPVLYFHSFTGCRNECAYQQKVVEQLGIRMIAPERPGYGISLPDEACGFHEWPQKLLPLLDYLGVDRFYIVAMSGSSAHALACAHQLPKRVRGLTLISPMGEVRTIEDVDGMMPLNRRVYELILRCPPQLSRFFAHIMARVFTTDPEAYLQRVTPHIAETDRHLLADAQLRAHIKATFVESRMQYKSAFSGDMLRYAAPWNIPLEKITTPVSVWHGDENRHIPLHMAKSLAASLPNCRAHYLSGEGYYLNYSHWKEILQDTLTL